MGDHEYDTGDWDGDTHHGRHGWRGWPEPAAGGAGATAAGAVRVLAASASYRPAVAAS